MHSSHRILSSFALAAGFASSLGAISACFNAPADDVLFSCASGASPQCPEGYSCEADGCCHKDGSDVEANYGGCALGLGEGMSESGGPADDESGTQSTEGGSSDTTG
jgi:hypothetical protein